MTNPPATPNETPEARLKRIEWENSVMEDLLRKIAIQTSFGVPSQAAKQAAELLDGIDGVRADTVG